MRIFVRVFASVMIACVLSARGAPAQSAASEQPPAAPVDLLLKSGDVTLAATLRFPSTGRAPFPAIVLAHGSGRITRDDMGFLADRFLGLGLAVVSWLGMNAAQDTLDASCDRTTKVCTDRDALAAQDRGATWTTANYVGWSVGIAGAIAFTALLLTSGHR